MMKFHILLNQCIQVKKKKNNKNKNNSLLFNKKKKNNKKNPLQRTKFIL